MAFFYQARQRMRRHRAILGVVLVALVLIVEMIIWPKAKSPLLVRDGAVDSITFSVKIPGCAESPNGQTIFVADGTMLTGEQTATRANVSISICVFFMHPR